MNRIIKSHLDNFSKEAGLQDLPAEDAFEHFINYCIGFQHTGASFDASTLTTDQPDGGIDGIICLIDNEIVTTAEEADALFKRPKRVVPARLIFTQATVTDGFSKAKLTSFVSGVHDFLQSKPRQPHGAVLKEYHRVFDSVIRNAHKVANGKPDCELIYATTGRYRAEPEIEAAVSVGQQQLDALGLFSTVSVRLLDADAVLRIWLECSQTTNASVNLVGQIALPRTDKIPEAYLGLVPASEIVEKILGNENGDLRVWVFNENVRAFLGADSEVNAEISRTIESPDARARFSLLNNGITIVSPDISLQGTVLTMNGFQIVNGCQTSNVLFENKRLLHRDTTVAVKFIEASDPDVISEIVRATNRQTRVEDEQFIALEPLTKRIEHYFNTYDTDEQRIYFERRFRQYVGMQIPLLRIFDIKAASRAVSSMFLNRPDLAMRYPNQMFKELRDDLFDASNKEIIFYAACLALYRVNLMVSSGKLPSNFRRMKWHLINALRVSLAGSKVPALSSSAIEKYCAPIIAACAKSNPLGNEKFLRAVEYVKTLSELGRNQLTKKTIAVEIQHALSSNRGGKEGRSQVSARGSV